MYQRNLRLKPRATRPAKVADKATNPRVGVHKWLTAIGMDPDDQRRIVAYFMATQPAPLWKDERRDPYEWITQRWPTFRAYVYANTEEVAA